METRNIIIFALFIFGLVYMQYIQAHPLKEIIRKYIEAREGTMQLQSIQSVYMEGVKEIMGKRVAIKITRVQGRLYRNDFEYGDISGYTIVTPAYGWYFIKGYTAQPQQIPEDRLHIMQMELDIAGPLVGYREKGNKVELEGKEDVDGTEAYKIRLVTRTGHEIVYFIDAKTNLVVQTRQTSTSFAIPGAVNTEAGGEVITNYAGYAYADGLLFPHIIINPPGVPFSGAVTFNKIQLNKPVEERMYRPLESDRNETS